MNYKERRTAFSKDNKYKKSAVIPIIAILALAACSGTPSNTEVKSSDTKSEELSKVASVNPENSESKEEAVKVKKVTPVGDNKAFLNMAKTKKSTVGNSKKDKLNANYHFNKANSLRESKEYEEAILEYKRAIRSYPQDGAFYKNLGGTFAMTGKLEDAELTLKRGCEVSPKDWLMWNNLAVVLQNLGKTDECKKAIQMSLSLKPPKSAAENMKLTLEQLENSTN